MTTTLTGTNWFGVKEKLDKLAGDFVKEYGDLALEKLDGSEATYNQILGSIESLPFLASKKMVIIQDFSVNKQAAESLKELLDRLPETTDLIIVESKLDKRSVYYKALKKLTDFQEFNQLDETQLVDWLVAQAGTQGRTLSKGDARYLVERVGNDQMRLARELDKLITYDIKISRENIDLLVDESPSSTIFNLLDSIFSGNLDAALNLYQKQRSQRVEPQAIHAMLVWQMHVVAVASSAPDSSSAQKIAADSGMNPFVVQKSQKIARKMDRTKIHEFLGLLRDIDYKSKRETIDYDEALKFAIIFLTE
jgi:DNA polymerase-3 subunit delta